ncbi:MULTISPECIES: cellulose-binding protein [unclassified Streptomyces]|uniref:cellulose-binding protein n=1 Tax=unclassified Streptomyces TaxID=2593676 RepID=UPI002258AFA7|nr:MULTISPECIES: cellulose-binding protein [unclassified Streptomyces]MCX4990400.1 cellulose-binding protein [Streptomyces sp. NBC_00568]MCX5004369.1 cellulose-binding protein [Streptomyces sp. NBC_00638]
MSSTSVSPHGFVAVRGRGYRPEQVDAYAAALSRDRDAAWERAARLTVLAKDMEAESERLREAVTRLAPQTYEELGERARRIFQLGEEEAEALRDEARREARAAVEEAEAAGREVREAARAYADEVHAEAEERARQRLLAARGEADEVRISARRDVKENRGEVLAALREVRGRTEALLTGQDKEHTARWAEAERAAAEREAAFDAHQAERVARAEESAAEAERALAEAAESDRHRQEDAAARAAELLAEARVQEERIARETERVLREHGERWDDVRAHMDHVRSSLTSLTGRAPAE